MADTVFHKIMRGELSAKVEHEDEYCIVIHTIAPRAPVHLLIIPRVDLVNLGSVELEHQAMLGHLLLVAKQVAQKMGIADGFKIAINNGEAAGQEVWQLHIHLMGGWNKRVEE